MNCVSCSISVYHLHWFVCVFFPGVFLGSRVTGACPVTTDLIMRVNMGTTNNNNYVTTGLVYNNSLKYNNSKDARTVAQVRYCT